MFLVCLLSSLSSWNIFFKTLQWSGSIEIVWAGFFCFLISIRWNITDFSILNDRKQYKRLCFMQFYKMALYRRSYRQLYVSVRASSHRAHTFARRSRINTLLIRQSCAKRPYILTACRLFFSSVITHTLRFVNFSLEKSNVFLWESTVVCFPREIFFSKLIQCLLKLSTWACVGFFLFLISIRWNISDFLFFFSLRCFPCAYYLRMLFCFWYRFGETLLIFSIFGRPKQYKRLMFHVVYTMSQ